MTAHVVLSPRATLRTGLCLLTLFASAAAGFTRDQVFLSAELAAALDSPAFAIGTVTVGVRLPVLRLDEAGQAFHVGSDAPPPAQVQRTGAAQSVSVSAPVPLHRSRISPATGAVRIVRLGSGAGVTLSPGSSPLERGVGIERGGTVVFPAGRGAALVLTPHHEGIKEDIVLLWPHGTSLTFEYELQLDRGLKAELMPGGEIQISALRDDFLPDAKAVDEKGRHLLAKVREYAVREVLYSLPAPIVRDASGVVSRTHARFELDGSRLRVVAEGLDQLSYPLSIDPTINVTSASTPGFELGGNFEGGADIFSAPTRTNFGFGVGAWTDTVSLPSARSSLPAVAYNGKLYTFGTDGTIHYAQTSGTGISGSWTGTTSLPLAAVGVTTIRGIGALAYNGYLYVAGGEDTSGTPRLSAVIYAKIQADGTLGIWKVTTSLPSARSFLGLVAQNGFLYALGGQTATGASPDVIVAPLQGDGSIGSWSLTTGPSAQLPIAFAGHGAVGYAGRLYVVGGGGGSSNTNVYGASLAADGTVGAWTALTSTPTPLGSNGAFAAGGYLYYVGGATGASDNADVYGAPIQANGSLGPWMQTTSLRTARRSAAVALPASGNGPLYVLGGNILGQGDLTTVQYANLSRQRGTIRSWATTSSLPTPSGATAAGIRGACAVAINGAIYVIGGLDSTGAQRKTVFRATVGDFDTGLLSAWTTLASALPSAVDGHTCEVEKGWIYVIGGTNNLTTVQSGLVNPDNTITWSLPSAGALQTPRRNHASVVNAGVVYVIGGENPTPTPAHHSSVESHSLTASGVFGQAGSTLGGTIMMPQARLRAAAVAEGGYIYVAGGSSDGTTALSSIISNDIRSSITMQSWVPAGTLPATLQGHRMVAHDGLLYVLGTGVGSSATVYAGRLGLGQTSGWTTGNPLTTARTDLAAVSIGTSIYAIGGASPSDIVYAGKLDSSAGLSNFVSQPPFATGRDVPAAAATSSFVYLVGGRDAVGTAIADAQYAAINPDGTLGSWTSTAVPPSRVGHSVFLVRNKLFHVGGLGTGGNAFSIRSASIQPDGSLPGWQTLGTLNNSLRAFHSIGYVPPTSANPIPSFYVLGGSSSTSVSSTSLLNTVEYVTLSSDLSAPTAITLAAAYNLPIPTAQSAAAVVLGTVNHCLFTVGGATANGTLLMASNRVFRALLKPDGSPLSSWSEVTGLPYGVYGAAAVVHGGHIFLIGGKTTPFDPTGIQLGPFSLSSVLAAPVDSSCNLGQWRQVGTIGGALSNHAAAAGNGNLYLLGGSPLAGVSTSALAATLRAPSPIGVYTRLYDLNSAGQPSSFDSVVLSSPGFPQPASAPLLQFKSAPIGGGVFGATQDLGPVALGASTAFVPPSMAQAQYLFLRLTLDDSLAVAAIADQPTHVDQINMNYTAAPVHAQLTPASGSYTAGTCQAFTLTLLDGLNNAVPTPAAMAFTASFPGTTGLFIDAPCSVPLGGGPSIPASLSTTTFFAKLTQAGGFTGTATSGALPQPTASATYTINPGTPSALAYVNGAAPSNIIAGQIMSAVQVRVVDGFGNAVTTAGISISVALVTPPNGVLSGTLTRLTDATGVATFNDLSMTLAGSFTLPATSAGLANANGSFAVSNAARAQLAVTVQPPNLVAGVTPAASGNTAAQSLNVAVQDQFGNVVFTDVTDVTIALAQTGATLSGTLTATPLNGIATFTAYSVDKAGTRSFNVTSGALQAITTATFSITAASAAGLAFAQQPSSAVAGVAIAPAITVNAVDAFGNLATTFTGNVVLTIGTDDSGGGLSLGGTLTRTAATGTATFNDITINKTSKTTGYALRATATINGGSQSVLSNTFAITMVNSAPTVTVNPANTTVAAGAMATFNAAAIGNPAPTVQWQVGGGTFGDIAGATATTLSITTATGDNGNQYRAVFTNSAGTATSAAATLTVLLPQTIAFGAAPTVVVGGTGTVSATGGLSGNPVTFTGATPTVCSITGSTVTGIAAGTCTIAADQAGSTAYSAATQATQSFSVVPGVTLNVVVSRKAHAGIDRDIFIDHTLAVGGNISTEPRTIGAGHRIVFQFSGPISLTGMAGAVDSALVDIGTASAAVNPLAGNEVIVTVTGIPDNRRVTVSLTNVNGVAIPFTASLGFLVGDVNGARSVNSSDISGVKARSGQNTDALNFRFDVNASGAINSSDISAVKARSGLVLAP